MTGKPNVSYPVTISRCHEMITALSDAYDDLMTKYDFEVSDFSAVDDDDILTFGLTPAEARALKKLEQHSVVTSERIAKAATLKESEAITPRVAASVVVLKLRKKLTPYGASIKTIVNAGYALTGLAEARVLAKQGVKSDAYRPLATTHLPETKKRWAMIADILKEYGPISVQGIVDKREAVWPGKIFDKRNAIRAFLKDKERYGLVASAKGEENGKCVIVWYLTDLTQTCADQTL